jgi:hypothetical protein
MMQPLFEPSSIRNGSDSLRPRKRKAIGKRCYQRVSDDVQVPTRAHFQQKADVATPQTSEPTAIGMLHGGHNVAAPGS